MRELFHFELEKVQGGLAPLYGVIMVGGSIFILGVSIAHYLGANGFTEHFWGGMLALSFPGLCSGLMLDILNGY